MAQLTQYSINSFSWAKNSVAASALEVPDDGLILAGDDPPRFQSWYMISPPVVPALVVVVVRSCLLQDLNDDGQLPGLHTNAILSRSLPSSNYSSVLNRTSSSNSTHGSGL